MFAPNLQLQHAHLVAMNRVSQMPLDYASYQVDKGQLEQAIETLERGRALFWSELRGFHNSVNQLSSVDPLLAEKWAAINRDLENLTMSVLPSRNTGIDGGGTEDSDGTDPFGRLLMKQRKLLEEREKIISQVQTLPGFDNFLTAPSFDTLRSAASGGPIIIINHSVYRSDILILLHDSPPSLIPTSKGFYDHANGLKDRLLDARKKSGLNSKEYKHALASVLADLYKLVGQPVIERLHELEVPEQSRIWLCPTSVFCSLPLHAMGPIPSGDGLKRYFLDIYIPSYTSTLSALVESRKLDIQPSNPSLLLVAQPDKSLPGVKGEIEVIQGLDIEVESLILQDATTAAVIGGLKRHQLVHFACHGGLETGKPFDASFKLHGDEHLTLLDIVQSRLPAAEVAFLAACHTAELTEESIDDEGLHLAAAVQYCGFRSAVGTMWAMADTDGRDLAHHFYHSMLSRRKEVPCHEKSAKALRHAVRKLRSTKGVTLERWVNFIHYGA
ncbi:CHAT domain-containing protein [Russula compacta]|nr:CHAT domain-containing protein [Russula compacta]